MATIRTKRCPRCGEVYASDYYALNPSKENRTKYGSPLKTCKSCGSSFLDDEYREIAVEGVRDVDTRHISPFGIFAACFGIAIFLFGLYVGAGKTAAMIMALCCLDPLAELLSYKQRTKQLEAERQASEERLKDPAYALALKKAGYPVPNRYLPTLAQLDDSF